MLKCGNLPSPLYAGIIIIIIMSNIFLSSDLHLGHKNILVFTDESGKPARVFNDIDEHNEYIIQQHNKVVGVNDTWYCLGDVAMNKRYVPLISRMNGKKHLIAGNHDTADAVEFLKYFDDVKGSRAIGEFIMTHIPVHPSQFYLFKANIHGHLHSNRVTFPGIFGKPMLDHRYYNVSMECLQDYTPISYEDAKKDIIYALEHGA